MSVLIRNARLLVAPAFQSEIRKGHNLKDIFISRDRISAIGNFSNKPAEHVIDAHGGYVAPGFIDANTHSDHSLSLFKYPSQDDFLRQGVTTMVIGGEGTSLAPLLQNNLDSLNEWAYPIKANNSWKSFGDFIRTLKRKQFGVNITSLVGYNTVRNEVLGITNRNPTPKESEVIKNILESSLAEGACGISMHLNHPNGTRIELDELELTARVASQNNSSLYLTLGNPSKEEAAQQAKIIDSIRNISVPVIVDVSYNLNSAQNLKGNSNIHFSISPNGSVVLPIRALLPREIRQRYSSRELSQKLKDPAFYVHAEESLGKINPDGIWIARATHLDAFIGFSLRKVMDAYEIKKPARALLSLLRVTDGNTLLLINPIEQEIANEFIAKETAIPVSHSASFEEFTHPYAFKSTKTHDAFLEMLMFAEKKSHVTLDEMVKKGTSEPARLFGINERGSLREGYFADIIGYAHGKIHFAIVNGKVAYEEGKSHRNLYGKTLIRSHGI